MLVAIHYNGSQIYEQMKVTVVVVGVRGWVDNIMPREIRQMGVSVPDPQPHPGRPLRSYSKLGES